MDHPSRKENHLSLYRNDKGYVCIECGNPSPKLYRDFKLGIIKISHCTNCDETVDKYIEFDKVIIFLDALLHKPQAYRHILFNEKFRAPARLLLIFTLCDTYLHWETKLRPSQIPEHPDDHFFYAALEADFYEMFAVSLVEWSIFSLFAWLSFYLLAKIVPSPKPFDFTLLRWALIVSSFGKLLALPTILWGQADCDLYIWLANIFIFTSNVSAVKVIYPFGRTLISGVLLLANLFQFFVGRWLYNLITGDIIPEQSLPTITTYHPGMNI